MADVRYEKETTGLVLIDPYNDFISEEMYAALDINIPNYATVVVTTDEVVQAISLT
jgi:hypothetical protein